ncbi:ABC transporter ATP-binding protein [Pseudobacteroides cellulosolvens]|uniref:Sulfate-transporting ATPase n=1 Tax=Pseudobacteroides cellulosolvens ATCC 35603 = DSM 2933 TaxID=398512 RepID=A0A0L6JTK3_9FIRM|nr:ATP-binding cassette domain-containing protein [Pseudobacteroides cellulosolvens]KNY29148.1 Sulfate-transporting ATPase [Pseudobacteroides cellulosolvens ATCC 35603 = DSM 2933]
MIEIQNMSKRYGNVNAVRDLSFTLEKGEILGFLGPNGAGKSTTMNIITGFMPPTSGTIKVCGYDVMEDPIEVKKRIGYLPEQPPLYTDMTVKDYLNYVCDLKHVKRSLRKNQLDDVMDLVKIGDVRGRLIKNLSKGYKQRVGLAQALVGSPEVLILDEPTVGLDPKQIIEIRNLIKALGRNHSIILSSHILPEVSAVCERVVIINKGRISAVDTPENLSKSMDSNDRYNVSIAGPENSIKDILKGLHGVINVESESTKDSDISSFLIESTRDADIRKPMFFELAKAGYPIMELKAMDKSLEDVFLEITKNDVVLKNEAVNLEKAAHEEVIENPVEDKEVE